MPKLFQYNGTEWLHISKDGKDADENKIINSVIPKVLERIPTPKDGKTPVPGVDFKIPKNGKDGSPDTPEQIRDKLKILKENDRLDKSAIKGLEEAITALGARISRMKGGGGGGMGNIQVETPSGTIDNSNTTFTITTKPKTNSQMLFVNGQYQRLTEDYTISGKTITMQWVIPTDSTIEIWYVR